MSPPIAMAPMRIAPEGRTNKMEDAPRIARILSLRASAFVAQDSQLAEKLNFLSFRGAPRAEESLFLSHLITERFFASLRMTK